jgi:hypothetical protein
MYRKYKISKKEIVCVCLLTVIIISCFLVKDSLSPTVREVVGFLAIFLFGLVIIIAVIQPLTSIDEKTKERRYSAHKEGEDRDK